jgi:hypothetical protein
MNTITVATRPADGVHVQHRVGAALLLFAVTAVTLLGSIATGPLLVSRLGLSADLASSIARTVATLGSVPWWALVIIGGGVAGVLVRLVAQYGWRYAASY